jgi:GT2 family glycosyltransferase
LTEIPVIILNWNGINDTIECVDSVLKQSFQDLIIYLVDNGSGNNEYEQLVQKYQNNKRIEFIKNEINRGFTLAHNQLFELAKQLSPEYVALINNDAIADKNWLQNAFNCAKEQNAQIVACKMINYYDRKRIDSAGLFLLSSGEILPSNHNNFLNSSFKPVNILAASGGACLYRFEMLNEIGFFDTYFSTGYEDAELGLRAYLAGNKIVYSPDSIVFHKISQSVSKIIDQKRIQKIQEDINYTYFKLMPLGLIIFNSIFNIPRIVIILFIHLFTFRIKFIKCQLLASLRTIHDCKLILTERLKFRKLKRLTTLDILKIQQFSLVYDLKRFYNYFIIGKKNQFEKY